MCLITRMKTEAVQTKYHVARHGVFINLIQIEKQTEHSYYIRRLDLSSKGYSLETYRKRTMGAVFNTFEDAKIFLVDRCALDLRAAQKSLETATAKWNKAKSLTGPLPEPFSFAGAKLAL